MAIKVDMAKAYDTVQWDVLMVILKVHGFSDNFSGLISQMPILSKLLNPHK